MKEHEKEIFKNNNESNMNLNNNLKKKLFGCFNEHINYFNTNTSNFAGRETNDISDWEDFNFEDNEPISELDNNIAEENDQELETTTLKRRKEKVLDSGCNEENFEIVSDDDDEVKDIKDVNLSNKCKTDLCNENLALNINFNDNQNSINCIFGEVAKFTKYCAHKSWNILSAFYCLFEIILEFPMSLLRVLFTIFKRFMGSFKFVYIPVKYLKNLMKKGFKKLKKKSRKSKTCKSNSAEKISTMNSNNNASDFYEKQRPPFCAYIFCFTVLLSGLFVHCWFNPESRICSINSLINSFKMKLMDMFGEIYILPGEDCMKAGRCCKGFMEANFRWFNCLITLPIRSILTAWPRQIIEKDISVDGSDNMKFRIEKIIQELIDTKDRTNKQEELIIKLRHRFTVLEKVFIEKSKDVIKLEPQLKYLANEIQQMRHNITFGINEMENIISIKHDSDKVLESMKIITRDSSNSLKALISKSQNEIEVEQHRLLSRIESLESLLNDDQIQETDSTIQSLNKIRTELDLVRVNQEDISTKINSLKSIPQNYRKISDKMKIDFKNRLTNELNDHDRMSKKTECFCNKNLNKFKEELGKSKTQFKCFIESMVNKEAEKIQIQLQKEISETFYDKTVEISKSIAGVALGQFSKGRTINRQSIKSSGFLKEFTNIEPVPYTCHLDETEKLLNYSAFCVDNKILNKTLHENNECLSNKQIKQLVKIAMAKYSADKIGLADFALESMGGSVISSLSSSTYIGPYGFFSFLMNPLGITHNNLRKIIQPGNQPGDCWPFSGSIGHAVIQLSHKILVNAISLEHLAARLNHDGKILSAPKQFQIYSLSENTYEKMDLLGTFEYKEGDQVIQTFLVEVPKIARIIRMDVLNNQGNKDYTCIYRLRIHGSLDYSKIAL